VGVIRVTRHIAIDENELEERFFHASGPGGQHVNKAATAVQLRFDAAHSPALPDDVRERLIDLAGNQVTDDGALVINAQRFRSQRRNRRDARKRLVALIRQAAKTPKQRRETKPSRASKERRLEEKRHRGEKKRLRRPPREW
jgi:ribosome-associated protein